MDFILFFYFSMKLLDGIPCVNCIKKCFKIYMNGKPVTDIPIAPARKKKKDRWLGGARQDRLNRPLKTCRWNETERRAMPKLPAIRFASPPAQPPDLPPDEN